MCLTQETVELCRVCYRCKTTGAVGQASGIDTFEDAQKRVNELNARYKQNFVYFAKRVEIDGVEPQQLLKLVMDGKISPQLLGRSLEPCLDHKNR